jgi:hypothetical protein
VGKSVLRFVKDAARQRAIEILDSGEGHAQSNDQAGTAGGDSKLAAVG